MYLTIITFKNGRAIPFQSEVPYSADKSPTDGIS